MNAPRIYKRLSELLNDAARAGIRFLRLNADGSRSERTAAEMVSDLGITAFDPASPGPIGGTTPAAIATTTLTVSGALIGSPSNTYNITGFRDIAATNEVSAGTNFSVGTLYITAGDIRNAGYAVVQISNPSLVWPGGTNTVGLTYGGSSGIAKVTNGSSGYGTLDAGALTIGGVAVPTVNTMKPVSYTVAVAAALSPFPAAGTLTDISDESGGAVTARSDGTVWKRLTDLATIS